MTDVIAHRESIFAKVETRMRALPNMGEVERMPSGDPTKFRAIHIFDEGQERLDGETGVDMYEMTIGFEGFVAGGDGAAAHAALSSLYAEVVTAMMSPDMLDGLVETIDETIFRARVIELASKRRLAFSLDFIVTFATRRGSPAIPA